MDGGGLPEHLTVMPVRLRHLPTVYQLCLPIWAAGRMVHLPTAENRREYAKISIGAVCEKRAVGARLCKSAVPILMKYIAGSELFGRVRHDIGKSQPIEVIESAIF